MPDRVYSEFHHIQESTLNEYLDGVLETPLQSHVEKHLAECGQCQDQLREIQAVFYALENLPEVPLKRDLSVDVLAALRPHSVWQLVLQMPASLKLFVNTQFLAVIVLLALIWPMLMQLFPFTLWDKWSLQMDQFFAGLIDWGVQQGGVFMQWLQMETTLWAGAYERIIGTSSKLQIPMMELMGLLVLASITWLVANGVLLGSSPFNTPMIGTKRRRS